MPKSRFRALASLLAAVMLLAFSVGSASAASPKASFTHSACYNSADETETLTISWNGIAASAYSFGAGVMSTGEGLGFVAPLPHPSASGSESWTQNFVDLQADYAGGSILNGPTRDPSKLKTVASFTVLEPEGGWQNLPAC